MLSLVEDFLIFKGITILKANIILKS